MVDVHNLDSVADLARVDRLLAGIWGAPAGTPVNLLRALIHTGHYVAGAFRGDEMVGAAVGFVGVEADGLEVLHSHITGVDRSHQGSGAGLALKLHQRDWARTRGIGTIAWTFDPLVRRNAWFNLGKLGARAVAYFPDFYGPMEDELNRKDESDRCLIHWDVAPPSPPEPAPTSEDRVPVLQISPEGGPVRTTGIESGPQQPKQVGCQIPADIEALRRSDPALAHQWRVALRQTMGDLMGSGFVVTTISRDGWYQLERSGP